MINANGIDYTISKQYWKVGACGDSEFKHTHVFPRSYLANGERDRNCPYTSVGFNVPKFKALDEKFLYGCLMTSHKDFFNAIPDEEIVYTPEELAHFKVLKTNAIKNTYGELISQANPDTLEEGNENYPAEQIDELQITKLAKLIEITNSTNFVELNSVVVV